MITLLFAWLSHYYTSSGPTNKRETIQADNVAGNPLA